MNCEVWFKSSEIAGNKDEKEIVKKVRIWKKSRRQMKFINEESDRKVLYKLFLSQARNWQNNKIIWKVDQK